MKSAKEEGVVFCLRPSHGHSGVSNGERMNEWNSNNNDN